MHLRPLLAVSMAVLLSLLPAALPHPSAAVAAGDGEAPETLAEGQKCSECHAALTTQTTVHNPVKEGQCDVCHRREGVRHKFATPEAAEELCLVCHELEEPKQAHPPVAEGQCVLCHSPHGSSQPHLLKAPAAEVCGTCHEEVNDPGKETRRHGAFDEGEGCAACHSGHGGARKRLLRDDSTAAACTRCHEKETKSSAGRRVAAVSALVKAATRVHGPVASGACEACHAPHGSKRASLLVEEYPEGPYGAFSEKAYGLCFQCHESAPFDDAASTDTAFRDGARNLHFLHVRRAKGRTCRLCHDPHASAAPGLVPDAIPFGKWSLRLGYRRTEDGGRCGPGCHTEKTFRR